MKTGILTTAFIVGTILIFAQSITNINPSQRTDGSMIVDIIYNIDGPEPEYYILTEVSFDNGVTFTPIENVTGDVGPDIAPGTGKTIEWDFGNEFPNQYSATTQIRITASLTAPWGCGDDFVDYRDSKTYTSVQIGTQCWMAENLNIGTMINGTSEQTDNTIIEKYCYGNSHILCFTYGGLYQWDEMMQYVTTVGTQGICPEGWHLPADAEWCTLENYVDVGTVSCIEVGYIGLDAGGNLKETGTTHWASPNTGATNSSGFTALPGGFRAEISGDYLFLSTNGRFWTSSSENSSTAWYRQLLNNDERSSRQHYFKDYGFSVRCVKD